MDNEDQAGLFVLGAEIAPSGALRAECCQSGAISIGASPLRRVCRDVASMLRLRGENGRNQGEGVIVMRKRGTARSIPFLLRWVVRCHTADGWTKKLRTTDAEFCMLTLSSFDRLVTKTRKIGRAINARLGDKVAKRRTIRCAKARVFTFCLLPYPPAHKTRPGCPWTCLRWPSGSSGDGHTYRPWCLPRYPRRSPCRSSFSSCLRHRGASQRFITESGSLRNMIWDQDSLENK